MTTTSAPVAGLLIAAVAAIALMHQHLETKVASDGDGIVAAAVIDQDDVIDAFRDLCHRLPQSPSSVIGGQHHHHRFAFNHPRFTPDRSLAYARLQHPVCL
jgi:hypothetical protein